jgi:hypothetical protein
MTFKISDEILQQTAYCPFDYKCLEDGDQQVCEVGEHLKGNGLILKGKKRDCPYLMSFGYRYICNCLTHLELYRHYHF